MVGTSGNSGTTVRSVPGRELRNAAYDGFPDLWQGSIGKVARLGKVASAGWGRAGLRRASGALAQVGPSGPKWWASLTSRLRTVS